MSISLPVSGVLVDTSVVSLAFKRDTRAHAYERHLLGRDLFLSFMSLAELRRWVQERRWGRRRRLELLRYLDQFTVHHSDSDLCRWWATVMVRARRKGRPLDTADAWIAATALFYDLPLVTHNPDHFVDVDGLRVITEVNP